MQIQLKSTEYTKEFQVLISFELEFKPSMILWY